jgi:hypothetical protein
MRFWRSIIAACVAGWELWRPTSNLLRAAFEWIGDLSLIADYWAWLAVLGGVLLHPPEWVVWPAAVIATLLILWVELNRFAVVL